jgi:hypothetical protein
VTRLSWDRLIAFNLQIPPVLENFAEVRIVGIPSDAQIRTYGAIGKMINRLIFVEAHAWGNRPLASPPFRVFPRVFIGKHEKRGTVHLVLSEKVGHGFPPKNTVQSLH